jgi:UPF0716 protein FxsA
MKILFLIFLVVPLIEIYLLIQIGSIVGAGTTIFLVVFTALLGALLVRTQGFSTLARVQSQLANGQIPAVEIIEGLFLFIAGALLLTPGFFTDAVGFIFLTPPLRRLIIHSMIDRGLFRAFSGGSTHSDFHGFNQDSPDRSGGGQGQPRVIDVEHRNVD